MDNNCIFSPNKSSCNNKQAYILVIRQKKKEEEESTHKVVVQVDIDTWNSQESIQQCKVYSIWA